MILNGVPPAPGPVATRSEILADLGLPERCFMVGLIGRLWPQKRVKDAIWGLDLLLVFRKDIHLLIIGDGPHRRQLERFRDQAGNERWVHFLGHRSDVARLMPHFDLLWSPSHLRGPVELRDGGNGGRRTGHRHRYPRHAGPGRPWRDRFLVPTRNRAAQSAAVNDTVARGLAKHTNDLLNNPELAKRLGEAGRRRMLDRFSVEQMVAEYASLYRRLLCAGT